MTVLIWTMQTIEMTSTPTIRAGRSYTATTNPRRPILYLRSFQDDPYLIDTEWDGPCGAHAAWPRRDVSYGRVQSEPCRRAGGRLEENLAAIVAPIASRRRHTGGGPSSAPATRSWIYSRSRRHSTIHYGQPRRNTESAKRHKPPDPVSTKRGQAHCPICWTKVNLSVTSLRSAGACTLYMLSFLDRVASVIP